MSSLVYAFQYLRRLVRECSDLRSLFVCVGPLHPKILAMFGQIPVFNKYY